MKKNRLVLILVILVAIIVGVFVAIAKNDPNLNNTPEGALNQKKMLVFSILAYQATSQLWLTLMMVAIR